MSTNELTTPALIVGAGPAGLMTALTLAKHGVESLLVERRSELSALPRATALSVRSMELLRAWGLEAEIRAGGVEVEWLEWMSETLAQSASGHAVPVGLPTLTQSVAVSPTTPACVPQDHVEPVLLDHLRSLAAARVQLGTEVVSIDNRPDGVRAVLRDVATGEVRSVSARYLVAADGARSMVRGALGIPLHGPGHITDAVTALIHAPLWELLGDRRYGLYFVSRPGARGIFLPAGPDDRWIYGVIGDVDGLDTAALGEKELIRLIQLGAGVKHLEPRIERIGRFSFGARIAERFRQGRAFLVGDAAHRVTPRGGTGMNSAMQGGYDLGWKLAWVIGGWGRPSLLDSYEAERRPVVEHNLARSIDPNGSLREVGEEMHVDLGGRIPHIWLPSGDGRRSTLDLLGSGLTLFTGPQRSDWDAAAAAAAAPVPVVVQSLDAMSARAIGIRQGGALLVRPDGVPAGWWPGGAQAAPALSAAVASAVAGSSSGARDSTAPCEREAA